MRRSRTILMQIAKIKTIIVSFRITSELLAPGTQGCWRNLVYQQPCDTKDGKGITTKGEPASVFIRRALGVLLPALIRDDKFYLEPGSMIHCSEIRYEARRWKKEPYSRPSRLIFRSAPPSDLFYHWWKKSTRINESKRRSGLRLLIPFLLTSKPFTNFSLLNLPSVKKINYYISLLKSLK